MAYKITDPKVITDDATVYVVPNSVSFSEGKGTQKVDVQSAGAGAFEACISDDVSTHVADFKFSVENTVQNVATVKGWKGKQIALTLIGKTPDGSLKRTFQGATMVNDPMIALSADGKIECEFKAVKVSG